MKELKHDNLLSKSGNIEIYRGTPAYLGATLMRDGVNLAVFSKHAEHVTLVIFQAGVRKPTAEIILNPSYNKTGDIWHVFLRGIDTTARYGYRMGRTSKKDANLHRFNDKKLLLDPYAKAIVGAAKWGKVYHRRGGEAENANVNERRSIIIDDDFDWGYDQPLNIPLKDSIIYEMHVRGFTQHPTSAVDKPGTYAGIVEKIPYLKELGITAVELLPIFEFEEMDSDRLNPVTGERLLNFWGYQPISFFAPKASYAHDSVNGGQVSEFKSMVKKFHEDGIEVILDVVFNHTAEGNEKGPTFSFKGIDNSIYYIIEPGTGDYHNYSGCGNTLNCNHPVVRDMIVNCLRYWVMEMHIDGFRFDLASILGRGRDGSVLKNPPLLERIAADPVLANTKLIAEAWDAAGLYQVGTFPNWGRWAEWNGKFRDDVRRFIRGEKGLVPVMMKRLTGSPDLYAQGGREPYHSINFITSHDGFTLKDLVSYDRKHNESNGEDNRDGSDDNQSWNCGWEGPTDSWDINNLRMRQMKNFTAILLISHGVPMILGGDELGRTQQGNNNAYCHDNKISWVDWKLTETNGSLVRFFRLLTKFRKRMPLLKPETFQENGTSTVSWHGVKLNKPDIDYHSRTLAMLQSSSSDGSDMYLSMNAYYEQLRFDLPPLPQSKKWYRVVDTNLEPPHDIEDTGEEVVLNEQRFYYVAPRSVLILISK
ncbi:glycogen debranching protein GlgX [Candidatus Magnetominusculus xianensis]|uniref:Glycogen debranching enzyme GlgX n=1 Tax=Candidatus Magnetominusculus xianensis TaxID=1748249 RepID=A0ABR5SGN2_9BACT|nr:glycogen debranching protein GlgX [Candidatus Magnetominusculus xianensis]KWT90159.1 glycogen debranching enzyme GlgX [Candidatus Magnetominusculus xianensis]MBF0403652.1 glycogen debranching protein GlgX [Nitrospirota bacterium]